MRYAKVHTRFWIDPDIAALGRDARELYLYLMTSPSGNMAGYYYLPIGYMMEHLQTIGYGYCIDTVSKALEILGQAGKVSYDPAAKVVLLRNHLSWNQPEGPKQVQGAITAVKEVPVSRLLPEFVACAKEYAPNHAATWDLLLEGYRYPIDTVSIPVTVTVTETVAETMSADSAGSGEPTSDKPKRSRQRKPKEQEPSKEPNPTAEAAQLVTAKLDDLLKVHNFGGVADWGATRKIAENVMRASKGAPPIPSDEAVSTLDWGFANDWHRQRFMAHGMTYLRSAWSAWVNRDKARAAGPGQGRQPGKAFASLQQAMQEALREEESH